MEKCTTTRLVEPLVRKGYLEKQRSDEDARSVFLVLTEEGRETRDSVWNDYISGLQSLDKKLPQDKRGQIYSAMETFIEIIHKCCDESGETDEGDC